MKQPILFWFTSTITLCGLVASNPATAQVVPDATLPNNSRITTDGNTSTINGGTQAGGNLFHSFEQFSVPTNGTAYFNNALDIQNIFSRVTGKSISNIDGLIRANDTANLFLINPNGIIFGRNARLNIGGSFLASTASSLNFADGRQFSAIAPQNTQLLTANIPVGLQIGGTAGKILNQSQATNSSGDVVGLAVQPGKTLVLLGGDLILDGGNLQVPDGQVELKGLAGEGTVGLDVNRSNLHLSLPDGQVQADVSLFSGALVNASGDSGGDVQLQGRRVTLTDGSQIVTNTLGLKAGGALTVLASESVELKGISTNGQANSGLFAQTLGVAEAGSVRI